MKRKFSAMVLTRHLIILIIIVIVSVVLAACKPGPFIVRFKANPDTICPGTVVNLNWDTTSTGTTLSKDPGGDIEGPFVDASGEATNRFRSDDSYSESVSEDTTYTLRAFNNPSAVVMKPEFVDVLSGAQPHDVGIPGICTPGGPVWNWIISGDAFGPATTVQEVTNQSGLNAFVNHAGILRHPLATGESTNAFAGSGISGFWKVEPEQIWEPWVNWCEENPGWRPDAPGDVVIPVPPLDGAPGLSEPPPTLWLRVNVGC